MADIKSMFANLATNGVSGGGGEESSSSQPPKKLTKKQTIEDMYQKKTQLEHILLRPDTYIGSVEKVVEDMWVFDEDKQCMVLKKLEYTPGLYKIFDEILVNAADNKQRDPKMDCIKISIDQENNEISVWNNGKGIPVVMHKEENMYVPTMIFGHLLTSSNYNDEEAKVTGGRNGYGAKLCNIFSTKFVVETASKEYKKKFKQSWRDNMSKCNDPAISSSTDDYTKITFRPDLAKFKMSTLEDDIVAIMKRRAFDVAASSRGVKVFLNGVRLPVKSFKDYVELYTKQSDDDMGNPLKVVYDQCGERWEVAVTCSPDGSFHQMSFVNSIATTKGGRHVDYVSEMIAKKLIESINKKNKGGLKVKPNQIKNHMWLFINCLIVNPTFDSQTKENMTLQMKSFGSKCEFPEKFTTQITKCGIIEAVLTWAKMKERVVLDNKSHGKKVNKLKGVAKLEDANDAGTKNSLNCTLILTEGDSAKSLAVSGLGVLGRDHYGVFPLRGKLLNVREATHKQILENAEINNLIKIIGLQYKKKYNSPEDMKSLRYGKVMIMTDQDQDGSHIKGLLINFFHTNWPELLRQNFLEEFITPIVKAKKRNETLSFYSLPEFEEWKSNTPNHKSYSIKYYKGLGTSSSAEVKEYFANMKRHLIKFRYSGQSDDDHIILAFSKRHVEQRKEWLTNFMDETRRRKEIGLSERYLYTKETRVITYTDFINMELILFSNADNVRSIPSVVDGFKPGQRKVIFTCIKRNDKREVKVAQLAGSVGEMSAYHHGEVSLAMTIVNLAQNFVGSNNINLLEPRGQFGTRLMGGKDAASARYIFTKMSPLTRLLIHPNDDPILKHEYDDNLKIEPVWYIPIIPMVLVNGAEGIGTGWMTKIANYNPRDLIRNIRAMLDGDEPTEIKPWYKNFKGTIDYCGDGRYIIYGEVAIIGPDKVEITELPVGIWTQNYKENVLEPMLHGSEKIKACIQDYREYHTDTTVKFIVTLQQGELARMEREGLHQALKLQTTISTNSMCGFDELNCLKKYDSVMDIIKEYYAVRLKMYAKRKSYMEGSLQAEAEKLSFQARFIMEKCNGTLVIENKKRKVVVNELISRGYLPDPVMVWKEQVAKEEQENEEEPGEEENEEEDEEDEEQRKKKKPVNEQEDGDVKKFNYLLGMSMWMLTDEKKNELLKQKDQKLFEFEALKKKTSSDLWRDDLDEFLDKLTQIEKKEQDEEKDVKKDKKAVDLKGGRVKKKKLQHFETLPSPMAKRVAPTISSELKKKFEALKRTKENKILGKGARAKKTKKSEGTPLEEEDEFDLMCKDKKTLVDKVGSPDDIGKKGKKGLKQTKLIFPKKEKKSPVKAKDEFDVSFSEDGDESDEDFSTSVSPAFGRERTARRAATKPTKYTLSDDDDERSLSPASDVGARKPKTSHSSESEDEKSKPLTKMESSEDMFDQLVGRKKESEENGSFENGSPVEKPISSQRRLSSDLFNSDSDAMEDESKENNKRKKAKISDSDDDDFKLPKKKLDNGKEKTKPPKKKKGSDDESKPAKKSKKKKNDSDSDPDVFKAKPSKKTKKKNDSDSDPDVFKPKPAKKGRKKKNDSDSDDVFDVSISGNDDDEERAAAKREARPGRNAVKSKYVFDDDSDFSD